MEQVDRIVLLEQGRIVDSGPHAELEGALSPVPAAAGTACGSAMSDGQLLLRLLQLFRPYWGWMLLGLLLSLCTVLANVRTAGDFRLVYHQHGAGRVAGQYQLFHTVGADPGHGDYPHRRALWERLVTHEATLRMIAGLRVWFYQRLDTGAGRAGAAAAIC
ncbi:MAG: hypothetical protein R3E89_10575 [Thiolinea sp.]